MIVFLQLMSTALRLLAHDKAASLAKEAGEKGIINAVSPIGEHISQRYKKSFAYYTIKERFPAILNNFAEDLLSNKELIVKEFGQDAEKDIQVALESVKNLKNEIAANSTLTPLISSRSDVPVWNAFLEEQNAKEGTNITWYTAVFLYMECYMYRRLKQIFELSNTLQNFDYYQNTKKATLIHSMGSCALFANHLVKELSNPSLSTDEIMKETIRMIKLSLWGNRFDMSISLGIATSSTDDPMDLVNQLEDYILADDSERIWNKLVGFRNANTTIDIVNDNSGYELFGDLCLADFLLTFGFASKIRFHLKAIPWYISDALIHDVRWTVDVLATMGSHSGGLPELSKRWKAHLDSGRWELRTSDFWTLPYEYSEMARVDPELYRTLSEPSMVFFKGDLNYRKLMADIHWPLGKSFVEALRGFQPTNLVALRTVKSETISGVPRGIVEKIVQKNPKWNLCGDYGLVQFSEK